MNYESLIDALTCNLNTSNGLGKAHANRHFLDNPKKLPCCNRLACNRCVIKALTPVLKRSSTSSSSSMSSSEMAYNCQLCHTSTRVGVNSNGECKLETDELALREFDRFLYDINHYLVNKCENSLKNLYERFQSKESLLSKRKEFIENEIHSQVEAIKLHLDQLELEMINSVDVSCKNMLVNLNKFEVSNKNEIDNMKDSIEFLKSNAFSYAYNGSSKAKSDNKSENEKLKESPQYESVNKCMNHLNELNKMNRCLNEMVGELKFDPNSDLPGFSLIGHVKQIKDNNLKEQFKNIKSQTQISRIHSIPNSNQKMPISPKYLCISNPFNLLFTDSQTKHLIQISLDTGDFMKSTNLNGQLKNPDGVCINPKNGDIYVSDGDHKCIFKLDQNLKIIKKFGMKELKWPRGMAFDPDTSSSSLDDSVINRLYICDYSNQRVAIYNEHEQLRDYLTISVNDELFSAGFRNGQPGNHQNILDEEENKFCPLNVLITKTSIYVTDDWTGSNCIRIFDKLSLKLLRNVGDLTCWSPLGLIVDDDSNIFTIARLYYETGTTHLFCFNKDGALSYKTNLNINNEMITDFLIDKYTDRVNHRIVCATDSKLHIFQF